MNVCFYGGFSAGGTEKAAFLLANRLKQDGYTVFLVNARNDAPTFTLDSIKLDYLPITNIPKRIMWLARYLRKNKIDILISVEAMCGIITFPAAKIAKCKHIIWEHANYFQNQGSKYIQKIRQIELLFADAYVVLTKQDQMNFKNHFKIKTKLLQIYNIAEYISCNCSYDIHSKTIISAGHIRKIKNFSVIPEIGKIIFVRHPDWTWEIYGTPTGDEYEKIKKKIIEYKLENNVLFKGRNNNLPSVYSHSSIYVMTSLQEGLPMVLLEAKACKLPIVSFDIQTGPNEIVEDGINGYLVPPFNIKLMADKINDLIENADLRQSMSDHAQMKIEQFDKDVIANQWISLFIFLSK